jgi:hypothetical protein
MKRTILTSLVASAFTLAGAFTVMQGPLGPLASRIGYADDTGALKAVSVGACGTLGPAGPLFNRIVRVDSAGALQVCGVTGGGSGDVATDTIWNVAGDIVQATGSDTAARLAIGTTLQILQVNAGATALEYISLNTALAAITGAIDLGGASSLEVPNGANPTTDAFAEVAGDNDAWAASRGTLEFFDGTASVFVVAALASDAPAAGQVPKWQTGGTITWEADDNSGAATEFDDIADPSGNGAIALAGTTHAWTSTLDSGIVLSITDTDADAAADTTLLKLLHNDGADANVIFLHLVGDADGTPIDVFKVSETAASFAVDLTVPTEAYDDTGWNGDLTAPTKDAIRDVIATIATFTDPNADKFIFWDDSAGAFVALTMPAAFSISGTTATLTLPYPMQFNAAVCQNATASVGADLPSTLGATGVCQTEAAAAGDAYFGAAAFAAGGADTEWGSHFELDDNWTGAVDVKLKWNSASTAAGDVVWRIEFGCTADNEDTNAISYNATSFTAVANKTGTAGAWNTATKTSITTTGCAAGETAFFIIKRDTDTAGDTLDQIVNLISVSFTLRRTVS